MHPEPSRLPEADRPTNPPPDGGGQASGGCPPVGTGRKHADAAHGRQVGNWKKLFGVLLLFPLVVAPGLVGVYMNRHSWGEWIRRLARSGFGAGGSSTRLGAIAPREPTVVYYQPGQLSLGDFSIWMYDPVTRTTLRADFRLDAQAQCQDRQAFDAFVLMYHRLVRDQVMTAVRSASLEELTDPDHRLLKRRIRSQVNRMLDQPFLEKVEIKNFSLWESVDQMSFLPYQPSPSPCPMASQ